MALYTFHAFHSINLYFIFAIFSENAEDSNNNVELGTSDNNESLLQINAAESSQQSAHRDSELLVYVCGCVYACVRRLHI